MSEPTGKMTTRGWIVLGLVILIGVATQGGDNIQPVAYLLIGIGLYFVPLIVAAQRQAPNRGSIAIVNIFLGWTVIGWVVALAMAMRDPETKQTPRP